MVGDRVVLQESYITTKEEILLNNEELTLAYVQKVFLEDIGIWIWICKDKKQNQFYIIVKSSEVIFQKFYNYKFRIGIMSKRFNPCPGIDIYGTLHFAQSIGSAGFIDRVIKFIDIRF